MLRVLDRPVKSQVPPDLFADREFVADEARQIFGEQVAGVRPAVDHLIP